MLVRSGDTREEPSATQKYLLLHVGRGHLLYLPLPILPLLLGFRVSVEGILIPLFDLFLAQLEEFSLFVSISECGTFALWLATL